MAEKTWGGEPFWGLGYEWDPDWVLTERQRELRDTLIELCEKEMRANAKVSDDELKFPRRNLFMRSPPTPSARPSPSLHNSRPTAIQLRRRQCRRDHTRSIRVIGYASSCSVRKA